MAATARQIEVPEDVTRTVFQGTGILEDVARFQEQYKQIILKASEVLRSKKDATSALASGLAQLNGLTGPVMMILNSEGHLVIQEAANSDTIPSNGVQPTYPTIQVLRERATRMGVKIDDLPPQAKQKILARLDEAEAKANRK